MADRSNDNEYARPMPGFEKPDAHGQAAMLLVESLIHELIASSIIQISDAIDVVTVAINVKMEIAADLGENEDLMDKSLQILTAIRESLCNDMNVLETNG